VAKFALKPQSPLDGVAIPGRYGTATEGTPPITLYERRDLQLCTIAALDKAGKLDEVVEKATGLKLPRGPKRVSADGLALIGTAPGQWLAVAEDDASRKKLESLVESLVGHAAITEQSHSKAVIRISGIRSRDALAKGCSLDLHPRVFAVGDGATTPVALIDCQIWQIDDTPTYDLAVPSSFAESFWAWLTSSAAEFGYSVEPAQEIS
jgi:methylglutamate dehydrogenase subunit D